MQTSFPCNMVALEPWPPGNAGAARLRQTAFVEFREEVITRRTIFELGKARDRAHVLAGLAVAVANIDEIIALIRNAPNPQAARDGLMAKAWPAKDVAPLIALIDDPEYQVRDGLYKCRKRRRRPFSTYACTA